jgi:peptide/nickel transport system substrate-binding protein
MKRLLILLAALLMVTMSLIGCANSGTKTTSSTPSPSIQTTIPNTTTPFKTTTTSITTTTTSLPSVTPKYGGTLKMALWASPSGTGGLPAELFGNDFLSSQHIIEPLLHVDGKGKIVPCLAESYKVADDMKSITFNLRKGVKFHDGTDFNAKAAKWNLDNTIASKSQPYWLSVDIIDDYTIRLNLNTWTNTILTGLDSASSWMVSPTAFDKNGAVWMRNNPVGTGPFKFVSFTRDVSYKAVRNPDYWMKGKPYLDAVEILYVADPMTQKAVLQSGDVDVLQIEPAKMAADLKALKFLEDVNVTSTFCMLPDTTHPNSPFANKKVREAVEYALDREAIAKAFSYGFWQAAYQIPAPSTNVYDPNFSLARKYDLVKAKQLMTEAGFPSGFKATLLVIPVGIDRNIAVAIQSNLAQIGITLEISIPAAIPKFLQDSNTLENVLVLEPIFSGVNWNGALSFALSPTQTMENGVWLKTPDYIKLYTASLTSRDMDINLIRAVINYLSQEAQVIPVFNGGSGYAFNPYVMDAGWNNRAGGWIPEDVWINK